MKTYLLLFICLIIAFTGFGQDIKNKKGVTYLDEKPFLKINGGSLLMDNQPTQILGYESNKLLFVLTKHYYTYQGNKLWYNELRFADVEVSFTSSYDYKPLIKSLYENGVLTGSGEIANDSIEKYIRLYGFTPIFDE